MRAGERVPHALQQGAAIQGAFNQVQYSLRTRRRGEPSIPKGGRPDTHPRPRQRPGVQLSGHLLARPVGPGERPRRRGAGARRRRVGRPRRPPPAGRRGGACRPRTLPARFSRSTAARAAVSLACRAASSEGAGATTAAAGTVRSLTTAANPRERVRLAAPPRPAAAAGKTRASGARPDAATAGGRGCLLRRRQGRAGPPREGRARPV